MAKKLNTLNRKNPVAENPKDYITIPFTERSINIFDIELKKEPDKRQQRMLPHTLTKRRPTIVPIQKTVVLLAVLAAVYQLTNGV